MQNVIEAEGLMKSFGRTQALAGVDLAAERGRVLALLGPNGAGKTTIVRILATLLKPTSGRARVCGYDVVDDAVQVRQLIALTGQYASVDDQLTGTENLMMIGRLLGLRRPVARARAREMIERFELTDAAGRAVRTYSGGMRRRLDLAASLLGQPEVLFLDEPTTGLDPRARSQMWDTVRGVIAGGATVLLSNTRSMPGWLQAWVNVNPVSHLTNAIRALTLGGPVGDHVLYTLAWAAGIVLVTFPLAMWMYRRRVENQ